MTISLSRVACVALSVTIGMIALGVGAAACSSSSTGAGGGQEPAGDGGLQTTCANPTLLIDFSPMYSAFIPGSTAQQFQIPAVMDDGSQATWTVSDPTVASLATQTFDGVSGVMITMQGVGTGQVTITATESGGACGASTLDITSATENDWTIGNQRYNDGVALHFGPPTGFDGGIPEGGFGPHEGGGGGGPHTSDGGSFFEEEGGTACTNCHGPTATNGAFNDVAHTPEQIDGFSDDELIAIITQGVIPDGGYFDPTVIRPSCDGSAQCTQQAYDEWHNLHQWVDITPDQYKGIVVYLRSLTPAPQTGTSNFGGGGGHHDGGFGPHDGGHQHDTGAPPVGADSGAPPVGAE